MPVILRQDDEIQWLSRDPIPAEDINRILAQYPAEGMEAYPVSERVNKPDADDEKLIEPLRGLFLNLKVPSMQQNPSLP
jgi:putative SOS response-associated peptidase YedK